MEREIVALVARLGRPVSLTRVANHLADARLWPPTTLLLQATGGAPPWLGLPPGPLPAALLRAPTPAALRAFLASRDAAAYGRRPTQLHFERGPTNLTAELVCLGGAACNLGAAGAAAASRTLHSARASPHASAASHAWKGTSATAAAAGRYDDAPDDAVETRYGALAAAFEAAAAGGRRRRW